MTIVEDRRAITGGVDTHADTHVAAALDPIGGLLGVQEFPVTPAGYARLLGWLGGFGTVALVGIVVGAPLGIVVGRAVWDAFAVNIGVVPFAVVDAGLLSIIVVCVLAGTALIALGPAIAAGRSRPGQLLRTE